MNVDGRECTKCHLTKPWDQFYAHSGGKNGRTSRCIRCLRQAKQPTHRLCVTCNVNQPLSKFLHSRSKQCGDCKAQVIQTYSALGNANRLRAKRLSVAPKYIEPPGGPRVLVE